MRDRLDPYNFKRCTYSTDEVRRSLSVLYIRTSLRWPLTNASQKLFSIGARGNTVRGVSELAALPESGVHRANIAAALQGTLR